MARKHVWIMLHVFKISEIFIVLLWDTNYQKRKAKKKMVHFRYCIGQTNLAMI